MDRDKQEQRGIYNVTFGDEKANLIFGKGDNCHSSPFADVIIIFYSDRNLNKQMEFKNLKVEAYYKR
ncbi:hypothetical protein [Helicobacter cinaedi]|uniref:hypothetical protein n=1 Tax=Helicobacter cinaedi TaxID=213 RepID=UPI000D7CA4DA|nr:hypothetical protein [Helicobacter cinaedi]